MPLSAEEIIKRFEKLVSLRQNWDSHWQDVTDYIIPRKDDVFRSQTKGEKKHTRLFDASAIQANELLASFLHGMMTNPSTQWFDLITGIPEIDKLDEVRFWLQDSVRRMILTLNNTNFQTEIHEVYLDLGSLGTGPMQIIKDKEKVVRFDSRPIYESYVAENNKSQIDTIYRSFNMSIRQLIQEFGKEFIEKDSTRQLANRNAFDEEEVIHAVFPRADAEIKNNGRPANFPFVSVSILKKSKIILKESGFREFPYVVPRWSKISGETYGRSPGMKALSDIQMLNSMMKTTIRAAQKIVDPPLFMPDDGILLPVKTTPGGFNYYRAGTADPIRPLETKGRIDIGVLMMDGIRDRIRQAFFVDQLQLQEGPQMTATEVLQRTEEKVRFLSPVLGRQQFELLAPTINRVFNIHERAGLFLEPPDVLRGIDIQVRYSSTIARAQKVGEAQSLVRGLDLLAPVAQAQPEILDNLEGDEYFRFVANTFGFPQEIIKTEDKRDAIRQARAEAQKAELDQNQDDADVENISKVAPILQEAGS